MNQVEKAVSLFEGNVNCSQAMLIVFGEPYGLDSETAKKLGVNIYSYISQVVNGTLEISLAKLIYQHAECAK